MSNQNDDIFFYLNLPITMVQEQISKFKIWCVKFLNVNLIDQNSDINDNFSKDWMGVCDIFESKNVKFSYKLVKIPVCNEGYFSSVCLWMGWKDAGIMYQNQTIGWFHSTFNTCLKNKTKKTLEFPKLMEEDQVDATMNKVNLWIRK